jgi:hypothetical protein
MNNGVMPDRDIIANDCAGPLKSAMYTGPILHIYPVAHSYKIYVTPHNGIKPDAAIITRNHITNNSRVGSNETIVSELRIFIFNRKYDRHGKKYYYKYQKSWEGS